MNCNLEACGMANSVHSKNSTGKNGTGRNGTFAQKYF